MLNKVTKIALVLALLSAANGVAGQEPAQPAEIRYLNDIRGVYVGEKQPNGKARIIIHRKDQGGVPEIHFVNGRRLTVLESRTIHGLLIGEVELERILAATDVSGLYAHSA